MIACSPLTGRIFSGRVSKDGNSFIGTKKDVTMEVVNAVFAKAIFHKGTFEYVSGEGTKWNVTVITSRVAE